MVNVLCYELNNNIDLFRERFVNHLDDFKILHKLRQSDAETYQVPYIKNHNEVNKHLLTITVCVN